MIKHFGLIIQTWILELLNDCIKCQQIPSIWRKSKVLALLKPGKDPKNRNSYQPILLLCTLYKLLERNETTTIIEDKLIPQQAGFRPGKSCCSQVLNLTQHIEDGFELGLITGAAFIDDTVNHPLLLTKLFLITGDSNLTKFRQNSSKHFYHAHVSMQNSTGKKSQW